MIETLFIIAFIVSIATNIAVVVFVGSRLDDVELNMTRYVGNIVCDILDCRKLEKKSNEIFEQNKKI